MLFPAEVSGEMADAVLIYSSDKRVAADRLRSAIGSAGYTVGSDPQQEQAPLSAEALAEKLSAAKAVIVIWSKADLDSALISFAADEARRKGKLIEVSADGIKPLGTVDAEMRIALLSGWRGEAFHPGWQKVLSELNRICGAREAKAVPSKEVADAEPALASAARGAVQPATGAGKTGSSRRSTATVVSILVLFLIVAAAAAWKATQTRLLNPPISKEAEPQAQGARKEIARGAGDPQASADARAQHGGGPALPRPASLPAEQVSAAPEVPVEKGSAISRAAADRRQTTAERKPPQRGTTNILSPTATMRLFCERSGRETPECRSFRRRMAGAKSTDVRPARAPAPPEAKGASVRYKNSNTMRLFCRGAGRRTPECRTFRRNDKGS